MPNINDIHKFYEANLPEYQRRNLLECNRFFLEKMNMSSPRLVNTVLCHFGYFKEYVVYEWLGEDQIRTEKLPPIYNKNKAKRKHYGRCECGGLMVKRRNRSDRSEFLGCNNWPKCNNTKPLLD